MNIAFQRFFMQMSRTYGGLCMCC